MAIESRGPLGGFTLTGADAERLRRHMAEDPPNQAAQATLQRGRQLLAQIQKDGVARGTVKESK